MKQERAARTRDAVLRAAAEVFAECGYAGASVARIAEHAGLTLGAVYFHFKSKGDLARVIAAGQPDLVVPACPSEGLQRVIDVTLTWARQLADDPILLAGARLMMEQENFVPHEQNSHDQWLGIVLADLRIARDRGEVREEADLEAFARLVVSACTGAQMHTRLESAHRDLANRIAQMWRCLLPAIATPEAAARIVVGEERGAAR
ncbi:MULTISPECIES: ScbR family autoregulator-binding transcription factor [unclassified Streptomyces]|uniref:ScbR family autoregulator-binding transcription factor n=1 Tax=unclassified Streptomyces TaxID=2593676 RepID=UPI00223724BA|nr:ScbR family autoregulator-binding transcription factor [Streptomyces sp. SHP 1-2]